jgi:hypothetical protein
MEEALWRFVDQNWRDSLNMEAAELQNMDYRQETRTGISEGAKKPNQGRPRMAPEAKVALASAEASKRLSKRCRFARALSCTGTHPLWMCKAFGDSAPEQRKKIIKDNKMVSFCLLYSTDNMYFVYAKMSNSKLLCSVPDQKWRDSLNDGGSQPWTTGRRQGRAFQRV